MKIFKNLVNRKSPEIKKISERFPENSEGDFYVENQVCIACGAPEGEAPDLIDHSKSEFGHCYFKKQPETPKELDRAISAMQVSCIAGIRYGGTDERILKKLYELGLENECDYKSV
ncbi:MAG: ferredoxin [Flavobacteriales bacterium]|nr:MAG: ferredoxin [Flavobacteriales bacterium]